MQVGESVRELDILAIGRDRTESTLALCALVGRDVFDVNGQESADPRAFVFQIPRRLGRCGQMHHAFLNRAKDEMKHVVEMHADVRGDAAGLVRAPQLVDVPVETLEFGKEIGLGEVAVDYPDRIVGVERSDQIIAGLADGDHVARGDIPAVQFIWRGAALPSAQQALRAHQRHHHRKPQLLRMGAGLRGCKDDNRAPR